ncbi:MAG: phosphohistidine phosphatase [Pseudonocardiales bacterium]|nr:phosphohistidine phosphatase [Pseudonocardiales bacterium]
MTPKQLVLIRHAKAADGPVDLERPLTDRGRRDAGAIGQFLARAGISLDLVVVSPALRARQTWERAQSELAGTVPLDLDGRIYDNQADSLIEVIHDTPAELRTIALVGHNPSFEVLAQELDDGQGDPEARQRLRSGYPTGGIAVFELSGTWSDLRPGSATLREFAAPRAR